MPAKKRHNLKDEKARATRRKILVEASKLFARQGFHKTTVLDIASAIGMTPGALFHHFPSKEALLQAVVERLSRGLEAYRAILVKGTPSAETVHRVMDLMVEHFNRQPEATVCLAVLSTEFAGGNDPILEKLRSAYDTFVDAFAALLAHHPAIADPRAAAIAFIGASQGLGIQGLLRQGAPPLEQIARAFMSMLNLPESW